MTSIIRYLSLVISRIGLRANIAIVGLVLAFLGIGLAARYLAQDTQCVSGDNDLDLSSTWQLSPSGGTAQIIWQLAEQKPRATELIGLPNSGIIASDRHVIFRREVDGSECDMTHDLIAFDLLTGREVWRLPSPPSRFGYTNFGYPSYVSVFRSVKAIPDGYVFISADSWVFKLDFDGQIEWWNSFLPSRSFQTIYYAQDHLFLSSYSRVYELDTETGNVIQTLEIPNVVAFFGNFAVMGNTSESQIEVSDWSTREEVFTVQLQNNIALQSALTNLWPFVDVYNDILFVYNDSFSPTHVEAYDISTGESLWSLDRLFKGFPIFLDNVVLAYTSDGLEIYDMQNGELLDQISMTRVENGVEDSNAPTSVWLAGYGNVVIVNFRDTRELVALQLRSQ